MTAVWQVVQANNRRRIVSVLEPARVLARSGWSRGDIASVRLVGRPCGRFS